MIKEKFFFKHADGNVEGIYINAGKTSPLVIIINGHNGFYNYGMFPHIQQSLFKNGISSYSFNYSHGGVVGDSDFFEDLEKYEKNCMRLETEDLLAVLRNADKEFGSHSKIFLLAHSLGGVPAIFGAKKALEEKIKIDGIILVSTVKSLNFWPAEMIKEWAEAGVYFKMNNRTKQNLPQGFELLQEILKRDKEWNVEKAIQALKIPVLIIHGDKDEAIPLEHGETLYSLIKNINADATFTIIKDATHTFNTKHPYDKTSIELDKLLQKIIDWINNRQG